MFWRVLYTAKCAYVYIHLTWKSTSDLSKMTVAIHTTVVPIRILILTTVVPIRILIPTTAIISALSQGDYTSPWLSQGYSYPSWWLMCNWCLFNWFPFYSLIFARFCNKYVLIYIFFLHLILNEILLLNLIQGFLANWHAHCIAYLSKSVMHIKVNKWMETIWSYIS